MTSLRPALQILTALLALLACEPSVAEDEVDAPNVLLIVADDLGYSDLGCYGGEIETPVLDSLAAGGVRLTQFYTTGRCCPSRASLLSGQYPHRVALGHMTQDIDRPGYRGTIDPHAHIIPQVLGPAYRSFMSGKWHLGTDDPTAHGFEEFYGTLVSAKTFFDPDHFLRLPQGREAIGYEGENFYATDAVTDHALAFLDQARTTESERAPWFLYLAYNAPHFPLHARPEEISKYSARYEDGWDRLRSSRLDRLRELGIVPPDTELPPRSGYVNYGETEVGDNPPWDGLPKDRRTDLARRMAIYAAMVDRMDQQIGRVISDLKEEGEFDNTLILFLSDNGACAEWHPFGFDGKSGNENDLHLDWRVEMMGSAGTYHSTGSGWANASNTPWRLYKHFCHEGGISSPCIIHWPVSPQIEPGSLSHRPAHLIDILTTIAGAAGMRFDDPITFFQGIDLLPTFRAEPDELRYARPLFFEHEGNRAIRSGQWKLVALRGEPWELYDLNDDRTELTDLAQEMPDLVESLAEKWQAWADANQVTPLPTDYRVKYLRTED